MTHKGQNNNVNIRGRIQESRNGLNLGWKPAETAVSMQGDAVTQLRRLQTCHLPGQHKGNAMQTDVNQGHKKSK